MNLSKLAHILSEHIDPEGGIWFSRMDSPAALHLPDGGVSVLDGADFLFKFLKLDGIGDGDEIAKIKSALSHVYLTRLEVELGDGDDLSLSSIFVGFDLHDTHWPLGKIAGLGDDIAIENPGVSLGRIAGEDHWEVDLHGTLSLWDAKFAISASLPDKAFSAQYQGKGLNLAKAAAAASLPEGLITGTVTEASLSANINENHYRGALTLTDFGTGGLTLDRCQLELEKIDGKISALFVTDIHITDGLDLRLTAQETDGTLILRGESKPGVASDFKLGQALENLIGGPVGANLGFVSDLRLVHVDGSYDGSSGTKHLSLEAAFGAADDGGDDDGRVRIGVDVTLGSESGATLKAFLKIGPNRFEIVDRAPPKDDDDKSPVDILAATYVADPPREFSLKRDLIAHATQREDVLELLPDVHISVADVAFVRLTPKDKKADKANIFAIDLGAKAGVNIAALPLIGDAISALDISNDVGVSGLQVTMATTDVSRGHVEQINTVLGDAVSIPLQDDDAVGLSKGFTLKGDIDLGLGHVLEMIAGGGAGDDAPKTVGTDGEKADDGPKSGALEISGADAPSDDAHWFKVEKKLGPLFVHKIGFSYREQELWVIPQADFTLSGLTISLDGFAASTPLDHFSPSFHLQGLGIDFKKGPMEIGGAFLRTKGSLTHADGTTEIYEEYCGTLVVKTAVLSLAAIGSYARLDDGPSMFVYLDLKYPLGGPPFFFVTGLSGGFGYNRALIIPKVKELANFPFVKMALENKAPPSGKATSPGGPPGQTVAEVQSGLSSTLDTLKDFVPPEIGQQWFAAGVHFTSFKIVDGFALLTVAFGHRFELHLLGKASFSYPPKADPNEKGDPLVRVDVLLDAAYLPEQGIIEMSALIADGSYVFEESCHLTGGLAFKTWFKGPNNGEFVFTLGGYHPKFKAPESYPSVERMGFNWQKSDALSIKGGMYFAMTGHALMAGGFLDATYESGCLKAWLKISADFLIYYKPFRYDAEMSVDVGAQVTIHFFGTHHLSVNLGADLHIWGPEFSGTASFDIWIASFSVSFGADAPVPPPIPWDEFYKSFLPQTGDGIAGVVAVDGLIKEIKSVQMPKFDVLRSDNADDTHWMIEPKHLTLRVNFAAPTHEGTYADTRQGTRAGIASMGLKDKDFRPLHHIQVLYGVGDAAIDVTHDEFKFDWIKGRAPAGLWGNPGAKGGKGEVNAPVAVNGTASSVELTPKKPVVHGENIPVEKKLLAFDTEEIQAAFGWAPKATSTCDWATLGADWHGDMTADAFDNRAPVAPSILDQFLTEDQRSEIAATKLNELKSTDLWVRDPKEDTAHG